MRKRYLFLILFSFIGLIFSLFFSGCKTTDAEKQALIDKRRLQNSPYTKYVKGERGHTLTKTGDGVFVYKDNSVYNATKHTIILPKRTSSTNFGPGTVRFGPEK